MVQSIKGEIWQRWSIQQQNRFLGKAVRYWRTQGFPYYVLDNSQIKREVTALRRYDSKRIFREDTIISNSVGLRLANYFHPQMWSVRCTHYKSPLDTFNDDVKLRAAIRKSLSIWPDRYGAGASCLRRMLKSFSNTVGVSNFRPTAAKGLLSIFASSDAKILDFSAGYGGRLLGAMSLDLQYYGIDPEKSQVRGLKTCLKKCRRSMRYSALAEIIYAAAEDVLPETRSNSYDIVFSSPPYYDQEKYGTDPRQSYIRYRTFEDWIEGFLRPVLHHSARVLKPRGKLIINMSNTRFPVADCIFELIPKSFHLVRTFHMNMAKLPYKRLHPLNAYKSEPVFVFKKK